MKEVTIKTCEPFQAEINDKDCGEKCIKLQKASRNVYNTTCIHFGEKLKDIWNPKRCQACLDATNEADEQSTYDEVMEECQSLSDDFGNACKQLNAKDALIKKLADALRSIMSQPLTDESIKRAKQAIAKAKESDK